MRRRILRRARLLTMTGLHSRNPLLVDAWQVVVIIKRIAEFSANYNALCADGSRHKA